MLSRKMSTTRVQYTAKEMLIWMYLGPENSSSCAKTCILAKEMDL